MSGTYQVEFPEGKSQDELEEIISVLEQKECVEQAIIHYASLSESESFGYSNESWSPTEGQEANKPFEENGTRWDVLYPDGPNWWAEAIWLPGIDDMDVEFSAVNVGIVDSMFDTAHPDLKKAFVEEPYQNPEKLDTTCSDYKHGTHVSGIIGARINNEGIAGVAPNARLYGFSLSGTKQHKYTALIEEEYAIATLLAKDVRIINYSWGTYALNHIVAHMLSMKKKNELTDDENSFLKNIEEKRDFFEIFFRRCEEQYDFLLFKAAGNANNLSIVRASDEDESNNDIRTCLGYRFYNPETDSSLKHDMIIKYDDVSCKDDI